MTNPLGKTARNNEPGEGRRGKAKHVKMAPLSGVVYAICRHINNRGEKAVLVVPGKKEAEEARFSAETFMGEGFARVFSHYELNPYEQASPDPGIVAGRIETLSLILEKRCRLVVATAEAFSAFTAPVEVLRTVKFSVKRGDSLLMETLVRLLIGAGYQRIPEVSDPGDFSVRGGIVDVFSPLLRIPVRLEFAGDLIESIRLFDLTSQRTVEKIEEVTLYPASEIIFRDEGEPSHASHCPSPPADDVEGRGRRFPGIEYFLPRIYGKRGMLLDYFDERPHLVFYGVDEIQKRQNFLFELASEIYEKREDDLPRPEELFITAEEILEHADGPSLTLIDWYFNQTAERELFGIDASPVSGPSFPLSSPLQLSRFLSLLTRARGRKMSCCIVVPTPYRLEVMRKILRDREIYPLTADERNTVIGLDHSGTVLRLSGMETGFYSEKGAIIVVTDREIFGKRAIYRSHPPPDRERGRIELRRLKKNDFVVHEYYGIGIFRGLRRMKVGDYDADFAVIEYEGGDILYLPSYRLDLIQKYVGGETGSMKPDQLGSRRWEQVKRRVREKVQKMAAELLSIHAERALSQGFSFDQPDAAFEEFASGFDFEETEDQERAITEVIENMISPRPMDRLVCGDVGYGKTEVALRATFLAVMAGKQVALLCPTTVLAQQHVKTFRERFNAFPVRVEVMSRFIRSGEQKQILADLEGGRVDVLIGTHRLLQSDVVFRDLGLIIIDEEQRFGVMHKEKLKKMRTNVDVLTLSATPIPRTFHIALSGIKDISLISTPPKERLSVRTFVVNFSEEIIREAIGRELRRGGQVYYVHNRIQTIGKVERFLRELFPEAGIEVAHGRMKEDELDGVMRRFYRGEVDVLLCTAIVESGLDVPRANTMIIDRSHTFGLAQLYQLRGRIGREKKRAYAYLIVPPKKSLSPEAVARLAAIEELTELGSGYQIASHDLDIRGGGDIIGPNQSGHVQHVGYEMYLRFLEEAVAELRGKPIRRRALPDVELGVPAYIPDEYIQNPQWKLDFYRKIALIRSGEDYVEALFEITDRFGGAPEPVNNLLRTARLRSDLSRLGVQELKISGGRIYLSFEADANIDRGLIARLALEGKGRYGFDRRGIFFAGTDFDGSNWDELIFDINSVLGENSIAP
ncbi:MAG: transcription-repair coupling factor [Deltaproteobacteria bacterium]|nr:transcription-repair coupling factor [Deltaproteobacteria bacterium]